MSEPKLGQLIEHDERRRDAIHVAIAPVVAIDSFWTLEPGSPIGFWPKGQTLTVGKAGPGFSLESVGIVDPFLKENPKPGERFWMFMYPNTVTSLRHVWTHPAFEVKRHGQRERTSEA